MTSTEEKEEQQAAQHHVCKVKNNSLRAPSLQFRLKMMVALCVCLSVCIDRAENK